MTEIRQTAVYAEMLCDYGRAVRSARQRQSELQQELRLIRAGSGGRGCQRKQQELIRRILLLREELAEMQDAMHCIRLYAAREVQS